MTYEEFARRVLGRRPRGLEDSYSDRTDRLRCDTPGALHIRATGVWEDFDGDRLSINQNGLRLGQYRFYTAENDDSLFFYDTPTPIEKKEKIIKPGDNRAIDNFLKEFEKS